MPKTRRAFTDEFKREAVKLVKQLGANLAFDATLSAQALFRHA